MAIRDAQTLLALFLLLLLFSVAALIMAWIVGRQWGDLSSRRRHGEVLTEEEQKTLRRSRRIFCIWVLISLLLAALSFYALH